MLTVNGCEPQEGKTIRPPLLSEFISRVFLPFQRGKWESSTAGTSEHRIKSHIVNDLGSVATTKFTLRSLQAYVQQKFEAGLSYSMVQHLRFDLKAIFRLAVAEGIVAVNPTMSLYKPQGLDKPRGQAITGPEVAIAVDAVEFREKVILGLAIFGGFRPGEILGLQRKHIANGASEIRVQQRVIEASWMIPRLMLRHVRPLCPRKRPLCCAIGWRWECQMIPKRSCLRGKLENLFGGTLW